MPVLVTGGAGVIGSPPCQVLRGRVPGGAGFIGSHLCEFLLARGCEVLCMDNLLTGSTDNIAHITDSRFLFVKHDVTNYIVVGGPLAYRPHLARPAHRRPHLPLAGPPPRRVLPFGEPRPPDRLPGAADPDPEGGRPRHPQGP